MDDRAASEVLSFALVFGLVVTSVAIISVAGLDTLQDTRDAEQLNNAKRAFDVLSDNLADLHQRGAPSRATEISLENARLYTADNVTINVSVYDTSGPGRVSVTRAVTPIVYEGNRDRALVYEGGAVFHTTRDGGRIDRDPPVVTRQDRLLVPIVQTRLANARSVSGTTVLVRASRDGTMLPVKNGTQVDNVSVNVTSPRSGLWREYFETTRLHKCKEGVDADGDAYTTCFVANDPARVYVPVHPIDVDIEV